MGRAIDMENRLDALTHRLKILEDAVEELLEKGTKVQHVDLIDERNVKAEGTKKRKATATAA